ncbi:MAG TPA: zf-HC2 domain-containing protein [Vicinamibacterales bacterium]|nr:zf-HC2 domain-containing protein [Vicinamibacterales bacterium]
MNARRPCPDSALLAAFIDGTLQDYERTAVVTHLSECGECRAVAMMVVEFAEVTALDELWHPPAPPPIVVNASKTRVRQWASEKTRAPALMIATAATVVAILIPAFLIYPAWSTRRAVASLVDAAATERPIDARVSGGFNYAPRGVRSTSDNPSGGRWQLVAAAGRVRDSFVDDPAVASRQAVGVAALLVGQLDDAITHLGLASSASPTNPEILNDLAAAYYERATLGGRPDDLPRALGSVVRALAVDPDLSDAWFNRALIVSSLGLRAEARAAWQSYLDRDSHSRWSDEARVRLGRIGAAPDLLKEWTDLRGRLAEEGTAGLAELAVRKHTTRSRDYIEREALKEWAVASDDDTAAAALDRLRLFANAFVRVSGEKFYAELVANIDATRLRGNDARYAEYLAAHRDYLNAIGLIAGAKFGEAAPVLVRVHSTLRRFDSPLALRVAIELAAADSARAASACANLPP